MYHHNVGYRHANGEVEGWSATRFGKDRARLAAMASMRSEIEAKGLVYDPSRVLTSFDGLTEQERATLRAHWKMVVGQ